MRARVVQRSHTWFSRREMKKNRVDVELLHFILCIYENTMILKKQSSNEPWIGCLSDIADFALADHQESHLPSKSEILLTTAMKKNTVLMPNIADVIPWFGDFVQRIMYLSFEYT